MLMKEIGDDRSLQGKGQEELMAELATATHATGPTRQRWLQEPPKRWQPRPQRPRNKNGTFAPKDEFASPDDILGG